MASKIIDLDAIIPDTFEVRMGGNSYSFPKKVMLDRALEMMKKSEELKDSGAGGIVAMNENFDFIASLFHEQGYVEVTADTLRKTLTLQQGMTLMLEMIGEVLSVKTGDEEKEGNP